MRRRTPKPDGFKQLMRGPEESKREEEEITRSLSVPKPEGWSSMMRQGKRGESTRDKWRMEREKRQREKSL